jgi:hypothetical protein
MAQLLWLALGLLLASSVAEAATANYTFTVLISIFSPSTRASFHHSVHLKFIE